MAAEKERVMMKKIIVLLICLFVSTTAYAASVSLSGDDWMGIAGKDGTKMSVDTTVSGACVIDVMHHEIHEGEAYSLMLSDAALADDATLSGYLSVPAGTAVHLAMDGYCEGSAYGNILKNVTVTANGTSVTPVNKNLETGKTSAVTAYKNPTFSGGTRLYNNNVLFVGGVGPKSVGASGEERDEWILSGGSAGVNYVIFIGNEGGAAKQTQMRLLWYEE